MKLKKVISTTVTRFSIVSKLKNYLQTVNNNQQELLLNKACIERFHAKATTRATIVTSFPAVTTSLSSNSLIKNAQPVRSRVINKSVSSAMTNQLTTDSRVLKVTEEEKCFTCNQVDHIVIDCSQKGNRLNYLHIKIQEIDTKFDEQNEKTDYQSKNY